MATSRAKDFLHAGISCAALEALSATDMTTALQVGEPLNLLHRLEEVLTGESPFQLDVLFQYHCILPAAIANQLDEMIMLSVSDKEKVLCVQRQNCPSRYTHR
jgi:hypothetical protein